MYKRPSEDNLKLKDGRGGKMGPGGYVIVINGAEDDSQKSRLRITYEVVEGDFYGESRRRIEKGWEPLSFFVNYAEKSQWVIGNFIRAVEETNSCHIADETVCKDLLNKGVGLVLKNHTYKGKTYLRAAYWTTADAIRNGEYEVPDDDGAKASTQLKETNSVDDGELPF